MKLSIILKIALVISIVVLLGNASVISRDYQDSWVLEGLEVYYAVFIITYFITFFSEKREKMMVVLAIICCVVMGLVPNLKYVWFSGRNIDQHGQYGLANDVLDRGYISTQFITGHAKFYTKTPLIHLSFAMFSTILNIPIMLSMKLLPIFYSTLFTLINYIILKRIKLLEGTKIFKYALFISSLPICPEMSYLITGRTYGILIVYLILSEIIILLQHKDRRNLFLLLFLLFPLALTHSTSSIILTMLLSLIYLFQSSGKSIKINFYLDIINIFIIVIINLLIFTYLANETLFTIIRSLRFVLAGVTPKTSWIPLRFFELINKDIFGVIRSIIVFTGADLFFSFFSFLGLIYIWRFKKYDDNALKLLFIFNTFLFLFLILVLFVKIGGFYWKRIFIILRISYPILSSISILNLIKRRIIRVLIFILMMFLVTIQFYACQPFIPPASTISTELPTDEPLVYVVEVNSIYQRCMINFADDFSNGSIASDSVTKNQIIGLAQYNFSKNILRYNPIFELIEKDVIEREYDYFLIHVPGKSGAFSEQAEFRTKQLILNSIKNLNIVYTNGESYICKGLFS